MIYCLSTVSCLPPPNWSKIKKIICNKLFLGTKNAFEYPLKSMGSLDQIIEIKEIEKKTHLEKMEKVRVKTGKLEMLKKLSEQIIKPSRGKISLRPLNLGQIPLALLSFLPIANMNIRKPITKKCMHIIVSCMSLDHYFVGC